MSAAKADAYMSPYLLLNVLFATFCFRLTYIISQTRFVSAYFA